MEWVKGVPGASGLQQWGPGSRARPQLRALPCGRCAEELAPERSTAAPRQPGQRKTLMRRRHARYDEKAARKIHEYRELYRDHRRQLDFVPAIASTLGRIHCELLRLLFLHAHRETTRFFDILDEEHAQPHASRFTYRRAAFFNTLKSKTGLMVARAAALRTNINIDGRPLPSKKRSRISSKACAHHLLSTACAPHFHIPVN